MEEKTHLISKKLNLLQFKLKTENRKQYILLM